MCRFLLSLYLISVLMPQAYERVVALGDTSATFALLQSGIIQLSLSSFSQVCTTPPYHTNSCSTATSNEAQL